MSFSFRNLFSQDESENSDGSAASRGEGGQGGRASFLPDGTTSEFQGIREGESRNGRPGPNTTRFMVSELLPFIPPAIAASNGIPMEQIMDIPLSPDGSRDVKLSTLYQLCPNLFASEITPLNDSVITLPPRLEEPGDRAPSHSEAPYRPEHGRQSNPFSDAKPPSAHPDPATGTGPAGIAGASPFGGGDASANPFWSPESDPAPKPASPSNNQKPVEQSFASSPFESAGPGPGSAASPFSQEPKSAPSPGFQPPGNEGAAPGFTGMSGKNAFGDPEPERKESEAQQPHPAQGQANPFGSATQESPASPHASPEAEEGFSTLFSKQAEKDTEIEPPSHPKSTGNPFANAEVSDSPFSAEAGNDFGFGEKPSGPATSSINPFEGTIDAIEAEEDEDEFEGYLPPAVDEETLSQIPGFVENEKAREEREQPANDEPVHFDDLMGPEKGGDNSPSKSSFFDELASSPRKSNAPKQESPDKREETRGGSFDSGTNAQGGDAHAGTRAPASQEKPREPYSADRPEPAPAVSPALAAPSFSSAGSIKDLELRAIFGIEEQFTIQKIAGLIADMQGISSCSISAPNGSGRAGNRDGATSGDTSREMARNVRQLAEFSGITDASTFTMQTDQGMVSLFLEGESCLTVRHDNNGFAPGVRERLILAARSLDRLDS